MISSILYFLGLIIVSVVMVQTVRTVRIYMIYKKKYGDDVKFLFYPLLGLIHFMQQSLKNHDDGSYFYKSISREQPNVKAIIILSGLFNYIIALDNDWVKYLSQDQDQFYKNDGCFAFDGLFGQSLIFTKGKKWKRQRVLLNSSFHYEALKSRVPIIKEEAKNFCSNLKAEEGFVKLNIFDENEKITSEIIARSFFNKEFKNIYCKNGKQISLEICDITQDTYKYRITNLYFILKSAILGNTRASYILNSSAEKVLLDRVRDVAGIVANNVDESIQKVIESKVDIYTFQPKNFIEVYIKEYLIQQKDIQTISPQDLISKNEIVSQYLAFFFAGTDTTAHLVSMSLYALTQNSKVYEKLLEEIEEKMQSYDDFSHNDLLQLSYLDAVIKESTRLYNVAPAIFPRRTDTDYNRDDLYISKDLCVMYRIAQFSENEHIFKDSDSFIPERFLNHVSKNPYEFIPFSSGSRNCIGQHMAILEAKYILLHILKNFDIKAVPNYKLRMIQSVVNQPLDKELILIKRK